MKDFKAIGLFLLIVFLILEGCNQIKKTQEPWIYLFDGKTLNGWHIKGGKSSFEVKYNTIIGTSILNTPNTFLCTDEIFDDFILELEYKVDPELNSGIQIRSNSIPSYQNGRVHGYQIEIDPSDRAWSGGIYDESRRGWLYPLSDNHEAQKAFKQNDWNKYRIEAIGDTIKTWINGVPAAYLIDNKTGSGFIGLQVHGIGNITEKNGIQVLWKNIKIITKKVEKYSTPNTAKPIYIKSSLTADE